jgi:hypothetical protein
MCARVILLTNFTGDKVMLRLAKIKRLILASVSVSALLIATPVVVPIVAPAAAQSEITISVEFRTALTPYGRWQSVPRWGEVWIPARIARDWQPYTVGNWIYSDEFGWYWISSEEEAEWGWVAFHYGRWINIDAYGWAWVPGNEWGPAWVDWRRSDEYAGWAPLPPDEFIVEYRDNPKFWMFVRMGDLAAPHLRNAFLSFPQRQATLQRTVVVNRTMSLSGRRFAVNPGIAPAIIAKAARQPVRTFEVMPRVVAGTANIKGATEISAEDLRRGGNRPGQSIAKASIIRQTTNAIQPVQNIPPAQALERNEGGRLGDSPPRAAVGAQERSAPNPTPTNQGAAPSQQPRQATTPSERSNQPPAAGKQAPPSAQAPAVSAAPPSQRREGPPPRDERTQGGEDRRGQSPASRPPAAPATQPPAASKQAPPSAQAPAVSAAPPSQRRESPPPRDERNQGSEDRRGQAPAPHAQPAPAQSAKVPAMPPSSVPSKTSAAPSHQEEKRSEDNTKR